MRDCSETYRWQRTNAVPRPEGLRLSFITGRAKWIVRASDGLLSTMTPRS